MTVEHIPNGLGDRSMSLESALTGVESFRRENDKKLEGVIRQFEKALDERLPKRIENRGIAVTDAHAIRSQYLHMFTYYDEQAKTDIILVVGSARSGLGIHEATPAISAYAARRERTSSSESTLRPTRILGHTAFIYDKDRLASEEDPYPSELAYPANESSTAVIHFHGVPSTEDERDLHSLHLSRPAVVGYIHEDTRPAIKREATDTRKKIPHQPSMPIVDKMRLPQMHVSIDHDTGFVYAHPDTSFDVLDYSEALINMLRDPKAVYLKSDPIDDDYGAEEKPLDIGPEQFVYAIENALVFPPENTWYREQIPEE